MMFERPWLLLFWWCLLLFLAIYCWCLLRVELADLEGARTLPLLFAVLYTVLAMLLLNLTSSSSEIEPAG
ncbi:hypothetical protein LOK49_LG13G01927 [Camellia lanceoleosa]|uniref:Uncharacterized protein n=1 Tax=Camellia lanceoleosa TaxID=1840588 RepID=A0ACC0FK48_9ERIC|nr:hypothetical protein LOK49_LG13G01927 [Camellia lanceoleosa]